MAGAISEAPVAPPSMTISGDTARVAWQVTDLRAASPEPTRRRWTYTVVLTEHAGVTVWLQEQESGLILPAGTRTVDRTVLSARLDSTHELRLAMSAELGGLSPASFETGPEQTMWIWHSLRGVDASGSSVRVDVRFPVVAGLGSPRPEGGL